MAQYNLAASVRTGTGKEAARKIRIQKQMPAVFYGPNAAPVHLTVSTADLQAVLKQTTRDSAIIKLDMVSEDGGAQSATVMIKELQVDPLRGDYLHADFYEISMDKEITADIGVNLVGEPIGVTKGGILQTIRRDITISCLPDKLIDWLDVDVSGLDIGDAVHVEDITFPEGMVPQIEDHLTVAVVAAPTVEAAPEEEAEEEVEGLEEQEATEETPEGESVEE
jgi:large subunit ribosomal protein L25